ncbi:ImmA/IrrE family metallo-endopeptidase [Lactococcus lactis]|uniref:ImmA/IrrE family metallo-endopeptidase n=1 Tax=Lactococcus lactis TaxID=1358 RepID=UPI001912AAA8|nr:ImmA/IrrE family metallo-endopeptidase [Lactococcus lactis]MBK5077359.1 ImmA/IrrE family metallo-endopeptidase [Lactococcus lactis]
MSLISELTIQLDARIIYFDKEFHNLYRDGMMQTFLEQNYIFISNDNSEIQTENILLHEIGHVYHNHRHVDLHSWGWNNRQEAEANKYMIEQRADQWLAQYDWEPEKIDYEAFLNYFELDHCYYRLAEKVFEEINNYNHLGAYEL